MKILVTGGCGFLGSHVCELFKEKGWDVVAYDNLTKFEYGRAFKNVDRVRDYNLRFLESIGVPTIIDDIRNIKMLRKAMNGCDFVAHCAAQPAMTIAIESPIIDADINIMGLLNLLEVCREKNIPIVNCSTIHIYGNWLNNILIDKGDHFESRLKHIDEDSDKLKGTISPLHASKFASELYVNAYIDTYKLPAANFRLTGIYGPRQFGGEDHGWVANFTIKTVMGQPIKIFGTDKQVRDILYVRDAAEAFYKWFIHDCPPGTYNIGGGRECQMSIRSLLDFLKTSLNKESKIEVLPARIGDLWWFISDYSKAHKTFWWEPYIYPQVGVWNLIKWIEDEKELFL